MRFIVAAALKDVRRRLNDPAALAVWLGIPLLLGGLLSIVFRDSGPAPRGILLVADQDGTFVSGLLVNAGRQGQLGELMDVQPVALDAGQQQMADGDASAMLVIPKGFQDAVLQDTPAQLTLITNPAQTIVPGIIQEALEIAVEGVFYAQRLFGEPIRRIADTATTGPPSNAAVAAISVEINERMSSLGNVLIPPVLDLQMTTEEPPSRPALNFGQLFVPGMLFMSFLFLAQGTSLDVWTEQTNGTLRRSLTTPQGPARILAGKLAGGLVIVACVALVALVVMAAFFDIAWSRLPGAWAWSLFAGGALLAYLMPIQMLATSARTADMLTGMFVFPLTMIGGSFFPFEVMPSWMAAIGEWTPNGQGVLRLKELLYGTPVPADLAIAVAAIALPAVIAFVVAARMLSGRFAAA